jgi:hypothetical protein
VGFLSTSTTLRIHMAANPTRPNPPAPNPTPTEQDATTPAEERGERLETGRQIARGGKPEGQVPGATGDDAADPRAGT